MDLVYPIVDHIFSAKFSDLPTKAISSTKRFILDTVGVAIAGSRGQGILPAYLSEEDWDRIITREGLKRYTPNTITDVGQLKAHLKEIRKKGYAFSDQEVDRDVRAVAAPILNSTGELVAGLSIAGPAYRINRKKIIAFRKLVVGYSQKISSKLGYVMYTTSSTRISGMENGGNLRKRRRLIPNASISN